MEKTIYTRIVIFAWMLLVLLDLFSYEIINSEQEP